MGKIKRFLKNVPGASAPSRASEGVVWTLESSASGGPEAARRWKPEATLPAAETLTELDLRAYEELLSPGWVVRENDLARLRSSDGETRLMVVWLPDVADSTRLCACLPVGVDQWNGAVRPWVKGEDPGLPRWSDDAVRAAKGDWHGFWSSRASLTAPEALRVAKLAGVRGKACARATVEGLRAGVYNCGFDNEGWNLCREALTDFERALRDEPFSEDVPDRLESCLERERDKMNNEDQGEPSSLVTMLEAVEQTYSLFWSSTTLEGLTNEMLAILSQVDAAQEIASSSFKRDQERASLAVRAAIPLPELLKALWQRFGDQWKSRFAQLSWDPTAQA